MHAADAAGGEHLDPGRVGEPPLASMGGEQDPHYDPVTPYEWEKAFMTRQRNRQALKVDQKVQDFLTALP